MPEAYPSAECVCGRDRQTAEHVILHCILHEKPREILLDAVETIYITNKIPIYQRRLNLTSLLSPPFNKQVSGEIKVAMAVFISAIDVDI